MELASIVSDFSLPCEKPCVALSMSAKAINTLTITRVRTFDGMNLIEGISMSFREKLNPFLCNIYPLNDLQDVLQNSNAMENSQVSFRQHTCSWLSCASGLKGRRPSLIFRREL